MSLTPNETSGESNSPRLPPEVHASPADVAPGPEAADLWWQPSWADIARSLGWRWLLMLPAAGIIALFVAGLMHPRLLGWYWWIGFKWAAMFLAIPIVLAGGVIRRAVAARKEPFCIHCGYTLTGLPDQGTCPECGSAYTRELIQEYRRDPHWFIQRHKAQKNLPHPEARFNAGPVTNRRRRSRDGT